MQNLRGKLLFFKSVEEKMGYEGAAARIYFSTLGKLIDSGFTFSGRNKRPPLDPFNSMISLGYSIILNEIYGKLENKFHADQKYLSYIDYRISFRRALDLQVNQLTKAIEENLFQKLRKENPKLIDPTEDGMEISI